MTSKISADFDVVVIGLGPTGATLANLLGICGLSVLVLEREAEVYPLPRAVHFDDEVMRVFQTVGVADTLLGKIIVNQGMRFCDKQGRLLLDWPRPQTITKHGWNASYRFHQPDLEIALRDALQRFPAVQVNTQSVADGVTRGGPGDALVNVSYRNLKTGQSSNVTARFLVGCDGARSATRERLQTTMQQLGFEQRWLVADLLLKQDMPALGDHTVQFCDPLQPSTYCRNPGRRRRWEFALQDQEKDEDATNIDSLWRRLATWVTAQEAELERCTVYTFKSEVARNWRRDNVFLAGDAAHLTPPFMGQGMCAGIRDASNLAWKLRLACRNNQQQSLLDSYQSERKPNVHAYIEKAVELGELINRMGRHANASDPRSMQSINSRLGSGLGDDADVLRGQPFPQCKLQDGQWLDDNTGYRFLLCTNGAMRLSGSAAIEHPILNVIYASEEPAVASLLSQFGTNAILVRPDRYILASGKSVADQLSLVQSLV